MFTGIVQQLGRIDAAEPAPGGARLALIPVESFVDLRPGESISVEGVCLTAEPESTGGRLLFFLSDETLSKTTLGGLKAGASVNLERSLAAGDRMGGHLVMGHVDGVGSIRALDRVGEGWTLEVSFPAELRPYLAPKGSVAVDGVSLTVVEVREASFTVAIIPHTYEVTSMHVKGAGASVNLEADTIARYVVQYLQGLEAAGGVTPDLLKRAGFE